jgi:hypothetical protein
MASGTSIELYVAASVVKIPGGGGIATPLISPTRETKCVYYLFTGRSRRDLTPNIQRQ